MTVRPNMGIPSATPPPYDSLAPAPALTSAIPNRIVNKFERIRLVRYIGLNTEESVLVESRTDLEKHADFLSRLDRYSVRTFLRRRESRGEPHFPIATQAELQSACVPLLDQGYSLIVAKPIDPEDAALAGCIVRRTTDFLIEVALGPGTARRVTHQGTIDLTLEVPGPQDPRCGPEIAQALRELTAAESRWTNALQLTDVLYEFSVYRHPVGWKNEKIIFWEIRGLGGHDTELDRFFREVVAA